MSEQSKARSRPERRKKTRTALSRGVLARYGTLDVIMIDPGRAEGITGLKKVIDLATDAGMSWNAHSWTTALSTAAALHLAAASPNVLVLELKPEPSTIQNELVTDPIVMNHGWIDVRDKPGLGVTVDDAWFRSHAFD